MGFGIGLGPRVFRVRVSTRGLGVSSGVGPFSVYAHTGRGRRRRSTSRRRTSVTTPASTGSAYLPGETTTTNLIGAGAHELLPTGSDELVTQLNRAQRWATGWGWAAGVCLVLSLVTPWFLIPTSLTLGFAIIGFARRRVLLNYEVHPELSNWFKALVAGWPSLASTQGKWRSQTSTRLHRTHHQKVNAGAAHLVARHPVSLQLKTPMALKTALQVPTVKAKKHRLMIVRVNMAHRLYVDILQVLQDNPQLIKVLDVFFYSLARAEYDLVYKTDLLDQDAASKVMDEFRERTGAALSEVIRLAGAETLTSG